MGKKEAMREALEATAGVGRLLKMAAVKSIKRNLETEDEAYRHDIDTHQRELWGEGTQGGGDGDGRRGRTAECRVGPASARKQQRVA